jgi:integrase
LEIRAGKAGGVPDIAVGALFERYAREVSPRKRGGAREVIRLGRMLRDNLALVRLPSLQPAHLAMWRDRRLAEVSEASVLRDWALLNHVFVMAVKEWHVLPENPLKGVTKPKAPSVRDRRITDDEITRLVHCAGYERDKPVGTMAARVGAAFLFAIETGMRAGEICALAWEHVRGAVAYLPMTKNGFSRSVPLSSEALRIVGQLPREGVLVFGLIPRQVDALFRKIRSRALIDDLHFHDSRHEAITRLARKLDVLDLARMVGIRDLKILMVYYNAAPSEIAARLG